MSPFLFFFFKIEVQLNYDYYLCCIHNKNATLHCTNTEYRTVFPYLTILH